MTDTPLRPPWGGSVLMIRPIFDVIREYCACDVLPLVDGEVCGIDAMRVTADQYDQSGLVFL